MAIHSLYIIACKLPSDVFVVLIPSAPGVDLCHAETQLLCMLDRQRAGEPQRGHWRAAEGGTAHQPQPVGTGQRHGSKFCPLPSAHHCLCCASPLSCQARRHSVAHTCARLQALAAKPAHVPFRDSKLTALLQDSLSGNAKAMMFIHIAPEVGASSIHSMLHLLPRACRKVQNTVQRCHCQLCAARGL